MSRQQVVSIHALAKSATADRWAVSDGVACFNPRAREERDAVRITTTANIK